MRIRGAAVTEGWDLMLKLKLKPKLKLREARVLLERVQA